MLTDSWGWRAAFGILVIDHDPVAEAEFWAMAPAGVAVNAARFASPRRPGTSEYGDQAREVAQSPDIARGLDCFGGMRLDAICVCFTTSSFLGGAEFDKAFAEQASVRAQGIPALTAAQATVAAMGAVGMTAPYVMVPPWFKDEIVAAGRQYLTAAGFPPVAMDRLDVGGTLRPWELWDAGAQWEVRPEQVYHQVRRMIPADADGVVIAGNGLRCVDTIGPLEADLGVPVVTSNQACLWHCLRTARVDPAGVSGYGRLFAA
ncbi:maleate cis-trans isomerase family protein [Actinokineospora xionganensis]|uniref:Maleate isomerase n=1 Tax=Actinokineospora xionganensis TaxID=2684470 RepID=A0ABR7L571_9PSEU|nr:hypothetical protein [Actinokineospora xionganensis]MBC6447546.1 hypothetical protein [Actinokineospora xionganensis]